MHASQIVDAGKFDKQLVAAQVVFLNDRLADAERVNSGANDLFRLFQRALLEVRDCAGLHSQREGGTAGRRDVVLGAVTVVERRADVAHPVGRSALDLDYWGMQRVADNRADRDPGLLQLTLDAGCVGIGGSADRFFDVNLKYEMRSAAQV